MKKTLYLFFLLFSLTIYSQNKKNYEITKSIILKTNETDSLKVFELRFTPKHQCYDLQKAMYEKFGSWNNEIFIDRKLKSLIWLNLKLFEDSDELYTIIISGEDKKIESFKSYKKQHYHHIYYCSAIVFNSQNYDCLSFDSFLKEKLVDFFIKNAKNIKTKKTEFEKLNFQNNQQ